MTNIVKKNSKFNGKNGLLFSIFFLIFAFVFGVFVFTRNSKVTISDQHPNLDIKYVSNDFLNNQGVSDILKKHNIKRISLIFTDQVQKTFSQTFDEVNKPYTSHSVKLEDDTLSLTIQIDEKILGNYNWSDDQISTESFYHVFVALYDLDNVKREDILSNYRAYINQNGQIPFLVTHDN